MVDCGIKHVGNVLLSWSKEASYSTTSYTSGTCITTFMKAQGTRMM